MSDRIVRILLPVVVLLVAVQVMTGILLAMHYVPSEQPARTPSGLPGTIVHADRVLVWRASPEAWPDTLALPGDHVLVPAERADVVPSEAGASVALTIRHQVPGGATFRTVHHVVTPVLVVAAFLLVIVWMFGKGAFQGAWRWNAVLASLVLAMAAAYSGRLLPDDVYAATSRAVVGHAMEEAPFGAILSVGLGLAGTLATSYAMHTLVLPLFLSVMLCLLLRSATPSWRAALVIVTVMTAAAALMPVSWMTPRDVLHGANAGYEGGPWWIFVPFEVLEDAVGAELGGYLVIVLAALLLSLPFRKRAGA